MKRINLKKIQKNLGLTLKKNTVAVGYDVCMHSTGIAVLRTTDNSLIIEKLQKITVPKNNKLLDCVDLFLSQLDEFKHEISKKYKIDISVIEDCFFGRNINTLKSLARFSILLYVMLKDITKKTLFVLPTTARKEIGFKKSEKKIKGHALKKEIMTFISNIIEQEIKDHDLADALMLAFVGLKEE